jgi:hypothetical protein
MCPCPECQRRRGEPVDDDEYDPDLDDVFDDDEDLDEDLVDPLDMLPPLPGVLREVSDMLKDEVIKAIKRGEDPAQFINRMLGPPPGKGGAGKKGRRK